ncbi:hypothetical protein [Hymenobacter volaticus]|uniref:Rubredoxin-like domain-containing protein n=1 Tax=Hymenobacter volaticus TaxID=2932254 RepID=A0ABY4G6P1_9BACT|nr:hypothetical protein [Hymenobacter volaticus]UOQ66468.1 hypothetical protein MUN86_00590 [Hymenobacter volaticus]
MADYQPIIACPKCNWQPTGHEKVWQCTCQYQWHTFDTAGQCPNCRKQWLDTWCPACGCVSKHTEWYRDVEVQWFQQLSPN